VARSDTVVDIYGVEGKPPHRDRYFSSGQIEKSWIIRNAVHAEEKGYDVFAEVCTLDHGFHEIREMVDIPVAFITESSLYVACMLAPKFAFLTQNEGLLLRVTQLAKDYGLVERMAPGGYLKLTPGDFGDMFTNPEPYVSAITEEASRVIRQGANILVLASNAFSMLMLDHGVREIDGVPLLDVCGTVVKVAELMVDLKKIGITRSQNGLFSVPSREERAQLRKLYGVG